MSTNMHIHPHVFVHTYMCIGHRLQTPHNTSLDTGTQDTQTCTSKPLDYGVATISRLLKIIGSFCKRAL